MIDRSLGHQLKQANLSTTTMPSDKEQWLGFLKMINAAYLSNKEARYLLEKSLDESTKEMTQLYADLKEEAEQRIQAIKESEKKSRFMENMSHELRTPIHGILGSLEIIKNDTNLDDKQKTFINTALTSGENLLDVVNNILDFSKINANTLALEEISFNIRELFTSVSSVISTMSSDKGLEFVTKIDDKVPARIKGDPSKVRQIMMNIASNAVKFTQEGLITFEISLINLTKEKTILRIDITDTGIGIPELKAEEIFNAFTQADSSTTREYEGIGLGLTISKELTKLMGGSIKFESLKNQGSHFWVDIPFKTINFQEKEKLATSSDLSNLKILIVEQDRANSSIFEHYFSMWNIEFQLVDNARDAINALYQSKKEQAIFDVAIVDYFIPGMDSLELSEILNSDPDFQRIPKVVLSRFQLEEEERTIANIEVILIKPIRETMLEDVLLECLDIKNKFIQQNSDNIFDESLLNDNETVEASNKISNDEVSKVTDILLTEDNPVNALIATTMVENIGLSVKHVTNGQMALDEMKKNNYRLILMDMHMPIMDGYNATKQIRQWERESHKEAIPIIALTANALTGDRDKCLAAGMDDYLPKPVKQELLHDVVTKWMEVSPA